MFDLFNDFLLKMGSFGKLVLSSGDLEVQSVQFIIKGKY